MQSAEYKENSKNYFFYFFKEKIICLFKSNLFYILSYDFPDFFICCKCPLYHLNSPLYIFPFKAKLLLTRKYFYGLRVILYFIFRVIFLYFFVNVYLTIKSPLPHSPPRENYLWKEKTQKIKYFVKNQVIKVEKKIYFIWENVIYANIILS